VDHFAGFSTTVWRDMKTYKDHAYAVSDNNNDGLMVFDLSQLPDTVIRTNFTQEFFTRSHNIFIDEQHGRMYAVGTNTTSNGVIIFDLTENPDEPQVLSNTVLPGGYVHDIYVRDHIGYCSHGNNGLSVYNFENPANPILLGSINNYPESGYNHSSWLDPAGEYLVFADETFGRSLKMTDVQDLSNMEITDLFKSTLLAPDFTNSIAHNPFIRDNYAIISYYHEGIQIYDLSDPENVTNVAYYDTEPDNVNYNGFTGAWGAYPYLPSGRILGSDTHHGLFVLSADSISFSPIEGVTFPEITLNKPDTVIMCEGESTSIIAETEGDNIRWFQDEDYFEEGSLLPIHEAGAYFVEASNGHCTNRSYTVEVIVNEYPELVITPDREIACEGETINVDIDFNGTSLFYNNGSDISEVEGNNVQIEETAVVSFIAYNVACETISEGFSFEFIPPPNTDWWPADEYTICSNEPLELEIPSVDETFYLIDNQETATLINSNTIALDQSGTYQILAENEACGTTSAPIELNVNPVIVPYLAFNETTEELFVSPAPSYKWFKDGVLIPGARYFKYTPVSSGIYTVETRDFYGCFAMSNPVEVTVGGNIEALSGNATSNYAIYPNPTSGELMISGFFDEDTNYQIFNQQGQLLKEGILRNNEMIDLKNEATGIYWIRINDQTQIWTEKIILQR
jgi:choice-of-anchor B domain-containing protein